MKNITFSVNQYDNEGDLWDNKIMLYMGENLVIRLKDTNELQGMIRQLSKIKKEIKENYNIPYNLLFIINNLANHRLHLVRQLALLHQLQIILSRFLEPHGEEVEGAFGRGNSLCHLAYSVVQGGFLFDAHCYWGYVSVKYLSALDCLSC